MKTEQFKEIQGTISDLVSKGGCNVRSAFRTLEEFHAYVVKVAFRVLERQVGFELQESDGVMSLGPEQCESLSDMVTGSDHEALAAMAAATWEASEPQPAAKPVAKEGYFGLEFLVDSELEALKLGYEHRNNEHGYKVGYVLLARQWKVTVFNERVSELRGRAG